MILHIDMDAFFAAVEQASNPRLKGRPVIVCGDPDRRGTVATASYEARVFGVHSGMATGEARRRCPAGVFVEGDPEKYRSISLYLLELYKKITPAVEPFSIDEAFLDLAGTPYGADPRTAEQAGRTVQRWVSERLGLSASVGIGPNKLIAKMAAGIHKPAGLTTLDEDAFRRRWWPQPVGTLWGIGEQTTQALGRLGIRTVGDLAHQDEARLAGAFGVLGPRLKVAAWGEDTVPVVPYYEGVDARSMGHEFTLLADARDPLVLEGLLLRLADQVARRMRREDYRGRIVVLKIRYSDFTTVIRQRALAEFIDDERTLFHVARRLLRENLAPRPVRLVGLTCAALERPHGVEQDALFVADRRARSLLRGVDRVRDRWGERAVMRAAALR
jgi:DNA polymerase-4